MPISEIPLTNGFYQSESLPISSQLCQNFYVNIPDTTGISSAQLFSTPGLQQLATTGDTEVNRGAHVLNDIPYFVNADRLYRFNDNNTATDLGEIAGAGRVSMSDNGTQMLIIVPGTRTGYIYDVTNGLQTITSATFTDPAKAAPEIGVFIDGYFVISRGSKEFFVSNLNDGLVYDALDFGSAEADPDIIRSLHVHKNQLYVFGSQTIEVFQNIGGAGFPFQRINGFVIPKGIAAPFSVTEFDGTFSFIGQGVNESPKVYVFTGSGVSPISTTSIDFLLQEENNIEDVFTFNYTFRGAVFVGFSTNDQGTLIYDAKASRLAGANIWHTRVSENLQEKTRWRVNSIVTAYNKLLVGDSESGRIGEILNTVFTEYGQPIIRQFALPTLENNSQPIFFNWIEAVLDSARGTTTNETPVIRMDYSDDGRDYTPQKTRSAGEIGQYSIKARWQQLGTTRRFRIFRFTMSDPINWTVLKVVINTDG